MVQLTKNNFNSFLIYNIMDNINRFIQFVYNKKQFIKMKETFKNTDDFKEIWKAQCSKYNIANQPSILPPAKRIIVIGDIHGDLKNTIQILKLAKVINDELKWIGGETIVVQVGDQIDRCRYDRVNLCNQPGVTKEDENSDILILQFFTLLHKRAQKHGGAVYSLLGNHELMNVEGDMSYVSHENIKGMDNLTINGQTFKDGMDARKYLFSPGNPMSNFLACTRQVALVIGSNLFVHAGILPSIANKYKIEDINKLMTLYLLNEFDKSGDTKEAKEYNGIFNNLKESPLWTRDIGNFGVSTHENKNENSVEYNKKCDDIIKPLTTNYNVKNIYVGHTPLLKDGIGSICNNQIWLTDYGSSKAFDKFKNNNIKEVQVLEILNDNIFNILKE